MKKTIWFPNEEYESRINKARELMARENMDILLITWDRNYNYFTGHRPITTEGMLARPNFFILPLNGEPMSMVHVFFKGDALSSTWIESLETYSSLLEAPVKELAGMIRSYKASGKRIGAELGQEQRMGMPVRDFLNLRNELNDFEFTDASPIIWEMRMIKSNLELDCIRQAQEITVKGYEEGFPLIREGMTEREAANVLTAKMVEHGADHYWIMMASGEGSYERISGRPTNRRTVRGDMVWVDMGASVNDYWADFSRAGVMGGPTDRQNKYQTIVAEVTAEAVSVVKAGVPGAAIVDACEEGMRKRGFDISFSAGRLGHGIGLTFTEPPSIARWDPVILKENMVISIEPGLVMEDGIYHAEENLIVKQGGCEVLSKAPRSLWTLG